MIRTVLAPTLALLALGLGACGSDGAGTATDPSTSSPGSASASASTEPEPSGPTTSDPPTEPACEEVWKQRGRIPRDYQGCLQAGEWVRAETRRCESGQVIVTFDGRYYGALGRPVNDVGSLRTSEQYRSALKYCG